MLLIEMVHMRRHLVTPQVMSLEILNTGCLCHACYNTGVQELRNKNARTVGIRSVEIVLSVYWMCMAVHFFHSESTGRAIHDSHLRHVEQFCYLCSYLIQEEMFMGQKEYVSCVKIEEEQERGGRSEGGSRASLDWK